VVLGEPAHVRVVAAALIVSGIILMKLSSGERSRNLASMNAWTLGLSTFLSTFGLAVAASFIRTRLPEAHLGKETQDVVRLGMGLVATMTALLLGLVTASAKSIFDESGATVRGAAVTFLTLDRNLARYGPETAAIRQALKDMLAFRIERTWPESGRRGTGVSEALAPEVVEEISARILALSPGDDSHRWLKSEGLRQSEELLRARWRVLEAGGNMPRPFLVAVILWLSATFASFGLYAPRNGTAVGVLGVAALSVAAAVFFIVELDGPFDGWIMVSSEPLRFALANLAR